MVGCGHSDQKSNKKQTNKKLDPDFWRRKELNQDLSKCASFALRHLNEWKNIYLISSRSLYFTWKWQIFRFLPHEGRPLKPP